MKKLISLFLSLITIFTFVLPAFCAFDSGTVTDNLQSKACYMKSLDESTVLFEKNKDQKLPAAGTVKLIEAVMALQKWGDLSEYVKITKDNLSLVKYSYGVRTAGYKVGEKVTKEELLNVLVVYGANDAASVVAKEVFSSFENYQSQVQNFLSNIGAKNTSIKNLTGFDEEGQYTTVYDIALIIEHALQYNFFEKALSLNSVTLKKTSQNEERTFSASNKMKNSANSYYYQSTVYAGKQTETEKAGQCAVMISDQDGYKYIAVALGGAMKRNNAGVLYNTSLTDIKRMLDWTYENIRYRVIVTPDQIVTSKPVAASSNTDSVKLVPEKEVMALVPPNAGPASVLIEVDEASFKKSLKAPIKKGEVLGKAKVYYSETQLAEINLVAMDDAKLSAVGLVAYGVKRVMTSRIFILIVAFAFVALAVYLALFIKKTFFQKAHKVQKKK